MKRLIKAGHEFYEKYGYLLDVIFWLFLIFAEQGDANAQYNLAVMYARGKGVLQNGATAADWYYKAGLSYLKEGKKDDALRCVEQIKDLKTTLHLSVPNAFLADKLLTTIYEGGVPNASPAPGKNQK
jgi:TPR repeat protein